MKSNMRCARRCTSSAKAKSALRELSVSSVICFPAAVPHLLLHELRQYELQLADVVFDTEELRLGGVEAQVDNHRLQQQ